MCLWLHLNWKKFGNTSLHLSVTLLKIGDTPMLPLSAFRKSLRTPKVIYRKSGTVKYIKHDVTLVT
jgi:hypothetical protein